MADRIYMDHHATTPCDSRVVEAMTPWFTEHPGNPASAHLFGWEAREAVEHARRHILEMLSADGFDVVFTSGATESNNLALFGAMRENSERGRHVVTTSFEHPSVLEALAVLEREGFAVTRLDPDQNGLIHPDAVAQALREDTVLCSVLWAHNEIGTIQPIVEIARRCRERGVWVHSDATQAVGRIPVDAENVDLLSFSGHKMYGPKGIGGLLVRRKHPRVRLAPMLVGGGQQFGYRSGTLPVPLIVGLGEAFRLAGEEMPEESERILALRHELYRLFEQRLEGVLLNGDPERRLPGNLNLSFLGVEAQAVLLELPGIALSAGSACHAGEGEPSPAILSLGRSAEEAHASLRFGLGRSTTQAEIRRVADAVSGVVERLRSESPIHVSNQRDSAGEAR